MCVCLCFILTTDTFTLIPRCSRSQLVHPHTHTHAQQLHMNIVAVANNPFPCHINCRLLCHRVVHTESAKTIIINFDMLFISIYHIHQSKCVSPICLRIVGSLAALSLLTQYSPIAIHRLNCTEIISIAVQILLSAANFCACVSVPCLSKRMI